MGLDVVLAASYFAGCAGILAHVADVLTCYSARPELEQLFHTPGDILDFRKASVMMAEKTIWELAAGHVLALIFIPCGFAGTCLLYKVLKPHYRWLRWPLVLLLFAFYVAGALMHCSFTFVGLLASAPARGHVVPEGLSADFQPFFEIICRLVGEIAMLPGAICRNHYMHGFLVVNPLNTFDIRVVVHGSAPARNATISFSRIHVLSIGSL